MTKASIGPLEKRLDVVKTKVEREQDQQEIEFICYWGDEVPDGVEIDFVTEWGGGALGDDKEATRDKYEEITE